MRYAILLFVSFLLNQCNQAPPNKVKVNPDGYRIVSYNVENLFDTWDEEFKFDDDFTPQGSYRWTRERYEKKINDIGKVLVNISNEKVPAIIGLIEVENKRVLEDLLTMSPLSKFQYAIVHEESPDERGIDVALLYDTEQFQYLDYDLVRIEFPAVEQDKTRDILLVSGVLAKDTVCFAVNHWPSRRGGVSRSEPKRLFVANELRNKLDEVKLKHPNTGFIIMGDFNDTPTNKSIRERLGAKNWDENGEYINLMSDKEDAGKGTYKYRNQWNMLDQFIVSRNLSDEQGSLRITPQSAELFDVAFLTEHDPSYPGRRLNRTFLGPKYQGGYSDHFPIVLDIELN